MVFSEAAQRLQQLRQLIDPSAFANINHQRGALDLSGVPHQVGEVGDQSCRKVIDRIKPQVFERLQRRELSRAADASDDDEFVLVAWKEQDVPSADWRQISSRGLAK